MMISNPFNFGNPIRNPERFIGRQSDLNQVVKRLRSTAHESTSIIGEERIGKTSLLKYLENKENADALGLSPDVYCMVYIDFQGLADITPSRFWGRVLQKIDRSISNPNLAAEIKEIRSQGMFDLFDLEDIFALIEDEGLTVVLLLDEFESVIQNPSFNADFFGGLRALAIHANLSIVAASRLELMDLFHFEELKGSPFFNIFATLNLRPFSQADVSDLLECYLEGTGFTFSDDEIKLIRTLSGGFPCFTQMAAYYVFDAKSHELADTELVQYVTKAFDDQVDAHYDFMWQNCSESEKITLLAVITLSHQKETPEQKPMLKSLNEIHPRAHLDIPELSKRGLLIKDESQETYHILSPSLEHWIEREIHAPFGEEETESTVKDWLSTSGHAEITEISKLLPMVKRKYWPVLTGFSSHLSERLIMKTADIHQETSFTSSTGIFICYSRRESAFTDRLVEDLQTNGVKTWRDVDNIQGARQSNQMGWRAAIENALENCAAMLIVLSPDAVESQEVQAEWNHFASFKRPIFPVIASNCNVPFFLKIYQIWDLSQDYESNMHQLAEALKSAVKGSS
ncbi:MAG: TIR domain-containing protein [Anaerolineae bacterium]|jgi:AAA+ ATPase superfamily predicted ATPase|nr:TIR domain-containing protein [Anaerolineae bacterium]